MSPLRVSKTERVRNGEIKILRVREGDRQTVRVTARGKARSEIRSDR